MLCCVEHLSSRCSTALVCFLSTVINRFQCQPEGQVDVAKKKKKDGDENTR